MSLSLHIITYQTVYFWLKIELTFSCFQKNLKVNDHPQAETQHLGR